MIKTSKQRDGIYSLLARKNYHPTADELYAILKKDFPNISIATVYRNLDQLSNMGRTVKIDIPNQPARYDGNVEKHFHVRCKECGLVEDVWLDFNISEHLNLNRAIPNFQLIEYDLNFSGICKNCKKKK
ncbi:MAG: transcriptional repressor [Spirochaetes bacterium]|jgi:Fur family peroxide stress response transcriptional regulator|nr:transcriptional repressor [Spirochaetota bacterium]